MSVATDPQANTPERFISITRARLIARYRMHTIPGKPEELQTNGSPKRVISIAYSGGEMRLRQHGGANHRDWIDVRDFRLRDGWLTEVYEYLDEFLGYRTPNTPTRPIRDNPQA